MKIGFIGLGNMGSAMAHRLVQAGHDVTVYNRSPDKVSALIARGARSAKTPAEAAADVELLVTMVADDDALRSVLTGTEGALASLKKGSVHASMSTIGTSLVEEIEEIQLAKKIDLVGAPVFGRPSAAAEGKLTILAAGPEEALERCGEAFAALSTKVIRIGTRPAQAHLCKILGNFMLVGSLELLAESMAIAAKAGLSPESYLAVLTGSLFTAPFYQNYGTAMVQKAYAATHGFGLPLAFKDVGLAVAESDKNGASLPVADLLLTRLGRALEKGWGELDVSSLGRLAAQEAGLETI